MTPTTLAITLIVAGALVMAGYMLAISVGELLARRDVPLPGEAPTWLQEAVRSVRVWTIRQRRKWRR